MRSVKLRRTALTLAMTGVLVGGGLPAFAATSATINGNVYVDANANGSFDAGEGLTGVSVALKGPDNLALDLQTVGADGSYSFPGLTDEGDYTVELVDGSYSAPGGSTPQTTVPVTGIAASAADPLVVDKDLAVVAKPLSIKGIVFDDTDRDGVLDTGESPAGDTEVTVWSGTTEVGTARTDPSGVYEIVVGTAGTYRVDASTPGQTHTTPTTVVVSDKTVTRDIGLRAVIEGQLEIVVYEDFDGNKTRDTDEDVLQDIEIQIRDASGTLVDTVTTDEAGKYFTSLTEGNYTVTVVPPAGAISTTPKTVPVTVGATKATADFGLAEPASYDGTVFIDTNGNEQHDAGETLIQGATIKLTGPGGSYTATTDAAGTYSVSGIVPGSYTVTVTLPNSYADRVNSLVYTTNEDFYSADEVTVDYFITGRTTPVVQNGSVKGQIYIDANKNQKFDSGEIPLTGTKVVLTGTDGKTYETTVDSAGNYSLTDLPPGTYKVKVTVADAYKNRVANPSYDTTMTITAGEASVQDYFISGAVLPTTTTSNNTSSSGNNSSTGGTTTAARTTPTSSGGNLAQTGTESGTQAGFAAGLMAMGAALLGWRRRRTTS